MVFLGLLNYGEIFHLLSERWWRAGVFTTLLKTAFLHCDPTMPDFIWINCSVWSMSRPLNASFAISKILIKFIRGPKSQQRRIMRTGWREQCTRSSPYNAMWSTHYDLERDVICSRGEVGSIRRIGVICGANISKTQNAVSSTKNQIETM